MRSVQKNRDWWLISPHWPLIEAKVLIEEWRRDHSVDSPLTSVFDTARESFTQKNLILLLKYNYAVMDISPQDF